MTRPLTSSSFSFLLLPFFTLRWLALSCSFLTCLLFLGGRAYAQDDAFYSNFGCSIGWSFAAPQNTNFKGFKDRFDADPAFGHKPMELGTMSNGGTFAFALFSGNCYVDFEYRALGLTSKYTLQPKPTDEEKEYSVKCFQHTGRFSYNYGKSFGKLGTSGIYLGAAVYAGTWDLKYKPPGEKMQRNNMDDFHGFNVGLSPQLTFRVYVLEVKAYYDYSFIKTDLAPMYNKLYHDAGAADASGDDRLKSNMGHAGVSVSLFIPFGKPSEHKPQYDGPVHSSPSEPYKYKPAEKTEREKSQERIQDMQRDQERRERQFNEKWNR